HVTRDDVLHAIQEYDRLGAQEVFAAHGFAPTTTYDLLWEELSYPPKAILGTAYELATGERLASGDFEGGKSGAVKVLGQLGFSVQPRRPAGQGCDWLGPAGGLAAGDGRQVVCGSLTTDAWKICSI